MSLVCTEYNIVVVLAMHCTAAVLVYTTVWCRFVKKAIASICNLQC